MNKEVKDGIIITITVLLSIVLVYFLIGFIMTGEVGPLKSNKKTTTTNVSSEPTELYEDMIIASKTFEKPENEYMVIFFSEKDIKDSLKTALSSYNKETKLYKVNKDEAINRFVISEEENPNATTSSELKINKTTLIVINNKKIVSYVTNEDDILNKIN